MKKTITKKPPKFSWVIDGLLAGHGRPVKHEHVKYLCENNFKYIVTLTINKPKALKKIQGYSLTLVHIPVQDETVPTLHQIQEFVGIVCKAEIEKVAVSVHCAWGRGRTGTMLACYLVYSQNLKGIKAIDRIRKLRPYSIDTVEQENIIKNYAKWIKTNKCKEKIMNRTAVRKKSKK